MQLTRSQRLLVIAFAISLLLHLIFAFIVHPWRGRQENEVEVVSIVHRPVVMTRLQTPPPRAKVKPHPAPSVRPAPVRRNGPQPQSGNGAGAAATSEPLQQPSLAPTVAANACEKTDVGAAVTLNPPQPEIPNDARAAGTSGIAEVNVRLDAAGTVTGASVSQSTGNSSLDLVAVGMARDARYAPALHACKPIASAYTFRVRFFAW
ncbi:MAG: energy transducer TonB [Candidatus Eremiobacteraeota bacterium]|nr:energy transducer TonB [Candidatus Eremiobacteraeota bacterium]